MDEPSQPFDEFSHSEPGARKAQSGGLASGARAGLRALSLTSRWIAIVTVGYIMLRHALALVTGSQPAIPLKSAVPLIAIGFSYLCTIVALPRTPGQRIIGFSVGMAFILWGVEQYLHDAALIGFIDDIVVLFFVIDLSIVIRRNLHEETN